MDEEQLEAGWLRLAPLSRLRHLSILGLYVDFPGSDLGLVHLDFALRRSGDDASGVHIEL